MLLTSRTKIEREREDCVVPTPLSIQLHLQLDDQVGAVRVIPRELGEPVALEGGWILPARVGICLLREHERGVPVGISSVLVRDIQH